VKNLRGLSGTSGKDTLESVEEESESGRAVKRSAGETELERHACSNRRDSLPTGDYYQFKYHSRRGKAFRLRARPRMWPPGLWRGNVLQLKTGGPSGEVGYGLKKGFCRNRGGTLGERGGNAAAKGGGSRFGVRNKGKKGLGNVAIWLL